MNYKIDIDRMKFLKGIITVIFLSVWVNGSFAQSTATKKQKEAEKKQELQEKEAVKAHEKAVKRHWKGQDKETQKRMKNSQKKANKGNRPKKWSAKHKRERNG